MGDIMNKTLKRIVFIILIVVFIVLCLVFEIPKLLYCEINTFLYVKEFDDPELFCDGTELSQNVDEIKVLSYSDDFAQVYYLTDNYQNAGVFDYKKIDGKWQYTFGYYPWTDDGLTSNADDPSAYWWFSILRDKYMPVKEKYKSDKIDSSDVIRNQQE